MTAIPKKKMTASEYLAIERKAELKSEFYNGEMFAMAGASRQHNEIKENLIGELFTRLKGGKCRTYSSDQRVKIDRTGLYTYPDIVIVCSQVEFDPLDPDTLTNPQVVIEVLSKTTESYDRGTKFQHYKRLPSVKEYVLVNQDRVQVDRFVRQQDETWVMTTFDPPENNFTLVTVDVQIPLTDIYRGVKLEEPPLP